MPVGSASAATRHDRAGARACRLPCHVCYMHVPSIAGRHRQTRVRHVVRADACKAKTNRTTAVIRPLCICRPVRTYSSYISTVEFSPQTACLCSTVVRLRRRRGALLAGRPAGRYHRYASTRTDAKLRRRSQLTSGRPTFSVHVLAMRAWLFIYMDNIYIKTKDMLQQYIYLE
jgi:hypothetical protein